MRRIRIKHNLNILCHYCVSCYLANRYVTENKVRNFPNIVCFVVLFIFILTEILQLQFEMLIKNNSFANHVTIIHDQCQILQDQISCSPALPDIYQILTTMKVMCSKEQHQRLHLARGLDLATQMCP